jgi:hypothetical protein
MICVVFVFSLFFAPFRPRRPEIEVSSYGNQLGF